MTIFSILLLVLLSVVLIGMILKDRTFKMEERIENNLRELNDLLYLEKSSGE